MTGRFVVMGVSGCLEIHRMLTAAGLGGEDQAALMEFFTGTKEIPE